MPYTCHVSDDADSKYLCPWGIATYHNNTNDTYGFSIFPREQMLNLSPQEMQEKEPLFFNGGYSTKEEAMLNAKAFISGMVFYKERFAN